ncbi:MAG TPA: hypothetical protein VJ936_06765, partial [Desulfobacteraceae bacterium]|nr:hypothetical protein [Desulfobacteraceae bacterium]
GRFKLIHCPVDPPLLYDLSADPDELDNLAEKETFQPVMARLMAIVNNHRDLDRLHENIVASQKRRRLVFKAHMTGKHTPWDFQPVVDASVRYMRNHLDLNDVEGRARIKSV